MITLFHAPRSRSERFVWLLEELHAPYEIEVVSIRRQDGSGGPDPKNPHPAKQVPAIVHDGVLVTESAAIALYLTDLFPDAKMGPVVGDPLRGPYLTWLAYYAGVLEPVISAKYRGASDPQDIAAYEGLDLRWRTALEAGPYLLGEQVSAADLLFVSLLQFSRAAMPDHRIYYDYLTRMTSRPASARAAAKSAAL